MGMKRRWVALLVLATACNYAGTEPDGDSPSGDWRWVASSGGIAGTYIPASSVNYTIRYRFSGNQVTVFRNDSARATSLITVRSDEITYQPAIPGAVFGSGMDTQTFRVLPGDTLVLNDPCCDMYTHTFVRLR